jgi:hypothetical protein
VNAVPGWTRLVQGLKLNRQHLLQFLLRVLRSGHRTHVVSRKIKTACDSFVFAGTSDRKSSATVCGPFVAVQVRLAILHAVRLCDERPCGLQPGGQAGGEREYVAL